MPTTSRTSYYDAQNSASTSTNTTTCFSTFTPNNDKAAPKGVGHNQNYTIESYFVGPLDLAHHSRWPIFLRLRGSIMPRMILPICFATAWSSAVTCIYMLRSRSIGTSSTLLTVLGFVVGLSLSFRNTTAYERYNDGRKYWAQLTNATQSLARIVWAHGEERRGHEKEDLLLKIKFCDLLVTFAFALKHRLRFEPFTHYEDLQPRLRHVPVIAHAADGRDWKTPSRWKLAGLSLGLPMAESNPRELLKTAKKPLGNIPLEILVCLSSYMDDMIDNGILKIPACLTQAMALLGTMQDILTGTDRILNTPLPVAYSICISQITWGDVVLLPFQLAQYLEWMTIPATVFAAYVILGNLTIGREIENPFGQDVNDLPLEIFCQQIRQDIAIITSKTACQAGSGSFISQQDEPTYPVSILDHDTLEHKSFEELRELLRQRVHLS